MWDVLAPATIAAFTVGSMVYVYRFRGDVLSELKTTKLPAYRVLKYSGNTTLTIAPTVVILYAVCLAGLLGTDLPG